MITAKAHITTLVAAFRELGAVRISLSERSGGDIGVVDVDVTVATMAEASVLAALLDAAPLITTQGETFAIVGTNTVWIRSAEGLPRQGSS